MIAEAAARRAGPQFVRLSVSEPATPAMTSAARGPGTEGAWGPL